MLTGGAPVRELIDLAASIGGDTRRRGVADWPSFAHTCPLFGRTGPYDSTAPITKVSIAFVACWPKYLFSPEEGDPEMYLLIRYPVGIIVEAVVLAKGRNRLRIVAAGFPDTIELKRSGSQWFTPTRQAVEFEFLLSDGHQDESASSLRPACVVKAVGSSPTQ